MTRRLAMHEPLPLPLPRKTQPTESPDVTILQKTDGSPYPTIRSGKPPLSATDPPQLNAENIELARRGLVPTAQGLVPKGWAWLGDAALETVVEPEAIVTVPITTDWSTSLEMSKFDNVPSSHT